MGTLKGREQGFEQGGPCCRFNTTTRAEVSIGIKQDAEVAKRWYMRAIGFPPCYMHY